MNPWLEKAREPILDYLNLTELETVCTRIPCDTEKLPEVIGSMRPRATVRCGHASVYTDPRMRRAMDEVADKYKAARGTIRAGFSGPIVLTVVSHRKMPKSWPKRRQGEQDTAKPDASNILKLVEDALNGIAYKDDSQIVAPIPLKTPRIGERDWLEIEVTYCEPRSLL
jgi:Holliday junction resolvase RusA-like endonuclease